MIFALIFGLSVLAAVAFMIFCVVASVYHALRDHEWFIATIGIIWLGIVIGLIGMFIEFAPV